MSLGFNYSNDWGKKLGKNRIDSLHKSRLVKSWMTFSQIKVDLNSYSGRNWRDEPSSCRLQYECNDFREVSIIPENLFIKMILIQQNSFLLAFSQNNWQIVILISGNSIPLLPLCLVCPLTFPICPILLSRVYRSHFDCSNWIRAGLVLVN